MDIRIYELPTLAPENYCQIEQKVNELQSRYRDKKNIDHIEMDWLDTANNWLMVN